MWISNVRINTHWLAGVIVMLVAASPIQADVKTLANKERVMGVCAPVQYLAPGAQPASGAGGSLPNLWAKDYFYMFEKRNLTAPSLRSVEIITQPKHGKVVLSKDSGGDEILQYIPNAGYVGQDRIEYRVNVEGHPVKLVYFVHVTKENLDTVDRLFCKANTWKISSSSAIGADGLVAKESIHHVLTVNQQTAQMRLAGYSPIPSTPNALDTPLG